MKYLIIISIPNGDYDVQCYDSLKLARMAIVNQKDKKMFLIKAKEIIGIPCFK